ncbi:AMP-binding enzyme [Microdochium trichocladiopsis]|uniref:AMP-binding enzyme n=1 Tax=Microdochium trichocladiopsis TaxID=1682393 RepID=A0A9P9BQG2_9PEZI|nr:AMP-binding enzyme [Microdochium trichocladiopsis]KAH7025842.1 AMP-binding enzyme [Microdochium trichocladiopsis]
MVIPSRWQADIPTCSVQQWVFGSQFDELPTTPQFIDPERPDTHLLTVADYRLWAKRIALGLTRRGLEPGDRVLLFSGNNIFTPAVFMGVLMAGGIFTGANPSFVPREVAYQLKDSGAKFMIAADKSLEIALEAAREAGLPTSSIFAYDDTALDRTTTPGGSSHRLGVSHWTSLLADPADAAKYSWVEPADPRAATCCLNYSSGTTGVPKGVEITHHAYVANGVGVTHVARMRPDYDAWLARQRQLCFLPLYHAFGQTYFTCNYPHLRVPVYIMPAFDFVKFLEYTSRFRISAVTAVPPIVVALAKHPLSRKFDLSAVESIGCGAAPLAGEIAEEVAKLWPKGHLRVQQGWGMTEVTCTSMGWDPLDKDPAHVASVGEMMPSCKARLVDPVTGKEVTEPNVRGELWVSGPTTMKGYWNKPDATASTVHVETADDGTTTRWLKTGDVAYVDKYAPGALFYIVDRLKELIKVKGNQVAPAELEGVLLEHKAVVDAAVVGVTINGEELPRAYVVPDPSAAAQTTEQDIAKWMEGKVVRYKWLKGGVKFVKEIPKNPSGKILRKVLRDQAAAEVGDNKPKL